MPVITTFGEVHIMLRFRCPNCNEWILVDTTCPEPNYMADRMVDSDVYEDTMVECRACNHDLNVGVTNGQGGMYLEAENVPPNQIYYRIINRNHIENFKINIEGLIGLITHFDEYRKFKGEISGTEDIDLAEKEMLLLKVSYVHAVTLLETLLFDEYCSALRSYRVYIRKFVESYDGWPEKKIKFTDIYKIYNKIVLCCTIPINAPS